MSVTQVEYKKKRTGTRYHADKKCYIGYRIDVWINNVRYRNARFTTRKAAETFIDELKLKQTYSRAGLKYTQATEIPRVSEVFAARMANIKNRHERVRATRIFSLFQHLLTHDLRVTEVRTAHFQLFINARLSENVEKETVNRDLSTLAPAFKSAPENFPEALEDFICPRIPRCAVKRHRGRTRVIKEWEKNLICDYLRSVQTAKETDKVYQNRIRIARMFELGWLLGMRFGEIAKLKKTDFDFSQKTLKVVRWKTDTFTLFEYLPEFICDQIKQASEASNTDFIYTISGNYPKKFYIILREAVEAAGLVYGRKDKDGITFHSNRHSFTTRLIQNTDLATAQSFTGHSTKDLLGYYAHATDESKRAAMQNLYGKAKDLALQDLREIFDNILEKKITFPEFCKKLSGVKIEIISNTRTQKLTRKK